jgi:TPR repeat protein
MNARPGSKSVFIVVIGLCGAAVVLLCPANVRAQSERGPYFVTLVEDGFEARPQLAKLTREDESALIARGYVKIGMAGDEEPGTESRAAAAKAFEAAILKTAGEAGGDLVRFEKEAADGPIFEAATGRMRNVCLSTRTDTTYTETEEKHQVCHFEVYLGKVCNTETSRHSSPSFNTRCTQWEQVPEVSRVKGLISEGSVWRFDPELAAKVTVRESTSPFAMYAKSAAAGDVSAMRKLGDLYNSRDHRTQARAWYEKAAARGNADAMNALGTMCELGHGGPKDYQQARQWYEKSVVAGCTEAMNNLALLYLSGNGVRRDPEQAIQWYENAAAVGSVNAMRALGGLYKRGDGVPRDLSKSEGWYKQAEEAIHQKDKAGRPGESARTLSFMLGKNIESVEIQTWLSKRGSTPEIDRLENGYSHSYKALGISFNFDKATDSLVALALYAEGADGFEQYAGELPRGLSFQLTRKEIEVLLGPPERSGSEGVINDWAVYGSKGIAIKYNDKRTDDPGLRIAVLTVMRIQ